MKTKTINLYSFQELSEDAKNKAIEYFANYHMDYAGQDSFDNIIEDAKEIGLEIISLEDHKANKGLFIANGKDTAKAILKKHGDQCETYKTAKAFLAEYLPLKAEWENQEGNEGFPFEYENQATDLSEDFLHSLLEDYRIMLNKDFEYLTSREAIIETIEANEYTFTESGKLEN